MIKTLFVDHVYIAIWESDPTLHDVQKSLVDAQALRAQIGRPLVMFSIITETAKMPSDVVRAQMIANWPQLHELASCIQHVNLTTGFTAARVIGMIVSVFALAKHGKRVSLHRSLHGAIREACDIDHSVDAAKVQSAISVAMRTKS